MPTLKNTYLKLQEVADNFTIKKCEVNKSDMLVLIGDFNLGMGNIIEKGIFINLIKWFVIRMR